MMELFEVDSDMADTIESLDFDELVSFKETQGDPCSESETEFLIYLLFQLFKRTASVEHLENALLWAEGWIAATSMDNQDRKRRLEILDLLMAEKSDRNHDANSQTNIGPSFNQNTLMFSDNLSVLFSSELDDKDPDSLPEWIHDIEWLSGIIEKIKEDTQRAAMSFGLNSLVIFLRCLYLRTKDTKHLRELTERMELLYRISTHQRSIIPPDVLLICLAEWSNRLFDLTSEMTDLDRAIRACQSLANRTSEDHPDRIPIMSYVEISLDKKFKTTNSKDDLERCLEAAQTSLGLAPFDSPLHTEASYRIAALLKKRANLRGLNSDIDKAIELMKPKVEKADYHTFFTKIPKLWTECLWIRFEHSGDTHDLDLGIKTIENFLETGFLTTKERLELSTKIGDFLRCRFEMTRDIDDVQRGICILETELDVYEISDNQRAWALHALGQLKGLLFQRLNAFEHLAASIAIIHSAMEISPEDLLLKYCCLVNLSTWYLNRYEATSDLGDIDLAIKMLNESRDHSANSENYHDAMWSNNMGLLLCRRFESHGDLEDLNQAIELTRHAIKTLPENHPCKSKSMVNLGSWIRVRFEKSERMEDLDECIPILEASLKETLQPDKSNRILALGDLGNGLNMRYLFTGSIQDLNRAVECLSEAVDGTPERTTSRASLLISLGGALKNREHFLGTANDLIRAIACAEEAVDIIPLGHSYRPLALDSLGSWKSHHARRTGNFDELKQALEASRTSLSSTPRDDRQYTNRADTVARILLQRFERTKLLEDIDEALGTLQFALKDLRRDDPLKAQSLDFVATILSYRFQHCGDVADIDQSIQIMQDLSSLTSPEDFKRCQYFWRLASLLMTKENNDLSTKYNDRVLDALLVSFNCTNGLPSVRIASGQSMAWIYAIRGDWVKANNIIKEVISLIPKMSTKAPLNHEKQASLEDFPVLDGLASLAAAISLNAGDSPGQALQLLEHGRGIISGGMTELRTELSDLKSAHPFLAQQFENVRGQLDLPDQQSQEMYNAPGGLNRRHRLEEVLQSILTEIRHIPGFEAFLSPITEKEMIKASDKGPLIAINVNDFRCDAFVVRPDCISFVPLPNINRRTVFEMAPKLHTNTGLVLEWLWENITKPVLQHLNLLQLRKPSANHWTHIWWISMGPISWFPLHAAGIYAHSSDDTVLDFVVSSYSSSIKSLLYSRQHSLRETRASNALLISMPETLGQSSLPSAAREIQILREICVELGLHPVEPAYPTREDVLTQIKRCRIFHFAGHGLSEPKAPSESCLVVHDWQQTRLTVGDLRDLRLHEDAPFLSYLSACSTGSTGRTLVDEGIHLVSACQLAGFRHVVGTLWEVSDELCVNVAEILYSTLKEKGLTDEAVSFGLHQALRYLRYIDLTGEDGPAPEVLQADSASDQQGQSTVPQVDEDQASALPSCFGKDIHGRTAIPIRKRKHQPGWHWVPYVHFGV